MRESKRKSMGAHNAKGRVVREKKEMAELELKK